METTKKGITGTGLKIIAIVTMFIDHLAAVIMDGYINNIIDLSSATEEELVTFFVEHGALYYTDMVCRLIGRLGFPIFCFLLVEGFINTKHLKKYIRNLAIFALISELPFNLGFQKVLFYPQYQNVFFTLLIAILVLTGIKYLGEEKQWSEKLSPCFYLGGMLAGFLAGWLFYGSAIYSMFLGAMEPLIKVWYLCICAVVGGIVLALVGMKWTPEKRISFFFHVLPLTAGVVLADLLKTDYSGWGVFTIAVIYFFRNNKYRPMVLGCVSLMVMSLFEFTALLTLIPVKRYNGQRGKGMKYFFYVFYPAHLFILYLIAYLLGFVSFGVTM